MAKVNGFLERTGLSIPQLVFLGIAAIIIVYAFKGGLDELVNSWLRREEYSHGFFIPAISLMFLWHRREALAKSIGKPSFFGLVLLLLAILLFVVGELSALFILVHLSFLITLFGLVLCLGGWSLFKVSFLPIVFLGFAIPMPYFIDAQLTWGLQLISSKLGTDILRLLGVPVYLQGNVIDLGTYQLQVVEACSGLNYLYPLLSLGFLAAYLFSAPVWQRAIVFLSTIPITIFMNSFRIAVIGVLVEQWGTEMAEGFLHFFEGWVIFLGCAIILVAEIWLLDRFGKKRPVSDLLVVPEIKPVETKQVDNRNANYRTVFIFLATVLLSLSAVLVTLIGNRDEVKIEREPLLSFPLTVGEWSAKEEFLPSIVENKLQVDDYIIADYRNANRDWLNFYIAYYESQRKGVSPHSPRVCIPGGGWLITDLQTVMIESEDGKKFPVNRIVIEKGSLKQLGYYWFEQRGRRIANEYWMKWYLLLDAVVMNRTDGALVRVMTNIKPNEDITQAESRVSGFMASVLPLLPKYVPGG